MIFGLMLWMYYCRFITKNKQNLKNNNDQFKCNNECVIVYYQDNKYDITDFVKRHPGGKEVLIENNGKNIEKLMNENVHSKHALTILEKYKIN